MSRLFFIILVFFVMQSCVGEKKSPLDFSTPESRTGSITVDDHETFAGLKSKILHGKCISCHQNFGSEEGIAKFVVPKHPETSALFMVVENGSMPKNSVPLTTVELEVITSYINNMKASEPIPTGKIDFPLIQKQILIPHCIQCHQDMTNEQNLMSWVNKNRPLKSIFLKVVKSGKMPKQADRLSLQDQDLIRKYLQTFIR